MKGEGLSVLRWYFEYLRIGEKLQIVRVKSERPTAFKALDFEYIYAIFFAK